MTKNKEIKAGSVVSLRFPKNIDPKIIDYINQEGKGNKNKYLIELLCSKIEDEMKPSTKKLTVDLPPSIESSKAKEIQDHLSSAFLLMVSHNPQQVVVEKAKVSRFKSLMQDEDEE